MAEAAEMNKNAATRKWRKQLKVIKCCRPEMAKTAENFAILGENVPTGNYESSAGKFSQFGAKMYQLESNKSQLVHFRNFGRK